MITNSKNNLVIANWKMAASLELAKALAESLLESRDNIDVAVAPSALHLNMVKNIANTNSLTVLAQDVSKHESGAFTGEISALQISEMGISGSVIGHSERRKNFAETDADVLEKIKQLTAQNLVPVVCIGENLETREQGKTLEFLQSQIEKSNLQEFDGKIVIAYEPVWAIGTGKVATVEQIAEVASFIHKLLPKSKILYGGSVTAANAKDIAQIQHIKGALVGGASLKIDEFKQIISSFAVV